MCTHENFETTVIPMDIFPSSSMLETRLHFSLRGASFCVLGMVIFSTERILDILGNRLVCMIFASLRIFQVTQGRYYMFSRVHRASGGVCCVGGWDVHNVRWNFHTWSILHVFQGTQGIWWGGLGGGGGDVITCVGIFTHGRYYMFSNWKCYLLTEWNAHQNKQKPFVTNVFHHWFRSFFLYSKLFP